MPRPFPGFDKLYSLGCADWDAFRADVELTPDDELAAHRGELKQLEISARWAMGAQQPGEVVFSTRMVMLVSERLVDRLQSDDVSGWSAVPCDFGGRSGEPAKQKYFLFATTGRCGPILYERSETFLKRLPGGLFTHWRGDYFEPQTWDGSDVFTPPQMKAIFVTSKAQRAFLSVAEGLVDFTPLHQVERPFSRTPSGESVHGSRVEG